MQLKQQRLSQIQFIALSYYLSFQITQLLEVKVSLKKRGFEIALFQKKLFQKNAVPKRAH